ncbi:MAG: SO2930 family diheme c-type cytochrome [Pseudomonadales bacterium]
MKNYRQWIWRFQLTRSWIVWTILLIAGCQQTELPDVPVDRTPALLSDWHLLNVKDGGLLWREDALPYDLNTPLFTDYAHKLRTVWMPEGTSADYREREHFDFPVGTVFTKTFYYPKQEGRLLQTSSYDRDFDNRGLNLKNVQLIETRILVKRETGWEGLPYVWNEDQTEARLKITGDIRALSIATGRDVTSFNYVVPNKNECASCHASNHTNKKIVPIGPKSRHLNKRYQHYKQGEDDQLTAWQQSGFLKNVPDDFLDAAPSAALWEAGARDNLTHRARSYLDINCGHCHSPVGPADTSGLFLQADETRTRHLGICKPPIAAGRGAEGRSVSIYPGKPSESMMVSRMQSADLEKMMPELGRSLVHEEGVQLVASWIASLEGACSDNSFL